MTFSDLCTEVGLGQREIPPTMANVRSEPVGSPAPCPKGTPQRPRKPISEHWLAAVSSFSRFPGGAHQAQFITSVVCHDGEFECRFLPFPA